MKYAVPVSGGVMCSHFGHCEQFALIDVNEKNKERVVTGSAEFVLGEATQLPWEDNKFSVATSMASFMMFPKPVESLKEMYRVLGPGGRVAVGIEWNAEDGKDHSKDIKKYGMQLWTEDGVRNMLKEAGFSDIAITYAKGLMMPKMMIARGLKK